AGERQQRLRRRPDEQRLRGGGHLHRPGSGLRHHPQRGHRQRPGQLRDRLREGQPARQPAHPHDHGHRPGQDLRQPGHPGRDRVHDGSRSEGRRIIRSALTSSSYAAAATYTAPGPDYDITPSAATGSGLGNYAIGYVKGNLHVNQRTLTITATDQAKTYGNLVTPAGTEFTTGLGQLVNGNSVTSVALTSSGYAAAATYTAPGPDYDITPSAATGSGLGNYAIGYVKGNLHVNQRTLTITATDQAKTYGNLVTPAGTEFTTGLGQLVIRNGVPIVALTSSGYAAAATYTAPGPDYDITPSAATGSGLGNYAI